MGADEIVHHLEEARPAATAPQDPALIAENARLATEEEHSMTFWQAAKRYKKACFWSAVVSLTIIMDGYDTALLGSLQAFPSFQSRFGHRVGDTSQYQLSAPWQVALGVSNSVGNIFGIYINSVLTERFGHKRALLGTLFVLTGIIFVPFFATSIRMLFAGEILCGLCWGVFTTLAPAYASEVCPVCFTFFFLASFSFFLSFILFFPSSRGK
ncbi:hypothetical protein VTK73DRAFT_3042 [Phialemonium thermophilum]|uniref:Major facilitator superfamily (MFS) profile domain-containing protein n=1 Tax=Phialemonium thermophilum TaxID=223376 RepID=A0ABR3VM67_9PEZI